MLYLCNGNGTIEPSVSALGSPPNRQMRTHIEFRTSEPLFILLGGRNTFGGIAIQHHLGKVDEDGMYIESFDLFSEQEWDTQSLLATVSGEMQYWSDYRRVTSLDDLYDLIILIIDSYTSDDISKCIEWDDFDDYLVLLYTLAEQIRRGDVRESDVYHFNEIIEDIIDVDTDI